MCVCVCVKERFGLKDGGGHKWAVRALEVVVFFVWGCFFFLVEILVDHGSFRDRYFMDLGGMCIYLLACKIIAAVVWLVLLLIQCWIIQTVHRVIECFVSHLRAENERLYICFMFQELFYLAISNFTPTPFTSTTVFRVRILHQNQLAAKGLAARLGRQIQVAPKVHGGKVERFLDVNRWLPNHTKPIYIYTYTYIYIFNGHFGRGSLSIVIILKGSLRNWCSCVNGLYIHLINMISGFFKQLVVAITFCPPFCSPKNLYFCGGLFLEFARSNAGFNYHHLYHLESRWPNSHELVYHDELGSGGIRHLRTHYGGGGPCRIPAIAAQVWWCFFRCDMFYKGTFLLMNRALLKAPGDIPLMEEIPNNHLVCRKPCK